MTAEDRMQGHEIDCARETAGMPRDLMLRFGDKWSLAVLGALFRGPRRFTQLHADVDGISHRLLTTTLRSLERDGLVQREEFDEMPRRVVYEMTALGATLRDPILAIVSWASEHGDDIERSRADFDQRPVPPQPAAR